MSPGSVVIRRFFEVCYIKTEELRLFGEVVIRRFFEVCYIMATYYLYEHQVVI